MHGFSLFPDTWLDFEKFHNFIVTTGKTKMLTVFASIKIIMQEKILKRKAI